LRFIFPTDKTDFRKDPDSFFALKSFVKIRVDSRFLKISRFGGFARKKKSFLTVGSDKNGNPEKKTFPRNESRERF